MNKNWTFKILSTHYLFLEPYRLYGEGNYALTSVKEIDGTEDFFVFAETNQLCQNKESYQDCLMTDYMRQGLELCNCTPEKL